MDEPILSDNIIYLLIGDNSEEYGWNNTWICYASKSEEKIKQAKKANEEWAKAIERKYYPEGYETAENKIYNVLAKVDNQKLKGDKSTAPYDSETEANDIIQLHPVTWSIKEIKEVI